MNAPHQFTAPSGETKKDFLIKKINEMNDYIIVHFKKSPFPNILEINLNNFIDILETYFLPYYKNQDYREPLKMGLFYQSISISDDLFEKHYEKIKEYLNIFLKIISD